MERSSNASFFYFYRMIRDWLRNIRMDYSSEQVYIAQRMLQEQNGWQSHLNNSQNFINNFVSSNLAKSINILGSGWLLDVPIDSIIKQFERVILTDIYHPKQIINKYSKFSNIEFCTIDLTHGVVDLTYSANKRNFSFPEYIAKIRNTESTEYTEDIVVSINLLSQLSIFITDYLRKKVRLSNDQLREIAHAIQTNHITNLPKGKSILITDYEEEFIDEDNHLIGTNPTVFIDIPKNQSTKEWTWKFDTQMTYREDCQTHLRVAATKI